MQILIAMHRSKDRQQLLNYFNKYGDCTIAAEDQEALDLFLEELKREKPFELACIDIDIPSAGGIAVLKAAKELEEQLGIKMASRTRFVMITGKSDVESAQTAFREGSHAFAVKPLNEKKMDELMLKLKLLGEDTAATIRERGRVQETYFRSVAPANNRSLDVVMETGAHIHFRFESRLNTARFGSLTDEALFKSVRTDGHALIFEVPGKTPVCITAKEFMDLVLVNRRLGR